MNQKKKLSFGFSPMPLFLAPMEEVSDSPFRLLCREQGADVVVSEFVSSEALIRDVQKSHDKMRFFPQERPMGIQLFGGDEDAMSRAAEISERYQPDFIDINFGCPVKKVVTKGAGAAVLKDVALMCRLTQAVVRATSLPVSVKTRLGWSEDDIHILDSALRLQDTGIAFLSLHARTRQQMYKGRADWEWMAKLKAHRDFVIPLVGNGDIDCPQTAFAYKQKYPVDGFMIGRAAIGNPWIFGQVKQYLSTQILPPPPSVQERVDMCKRHLSLSVEYKGSRRAIAEMRKHYAPYFKELPHVKPMRQQLVLAQTITHIHDILAEMVFTYHSLSAQEPLSPVAAIGCVDTGQEANCSAGGQNQVSCL